MTVEILQEVCLPFLGTTLGAASIFLIKEKLNIRQQRMYISFGAGLMAGASIFSLLLPALAMPALESAVQMGRMSFVPAVIGFWIGILFLAGMEKGISYFYQNHIYQNHIIAEDSNDRKQRIMMILALVLHNIPEGMAVGVVYAGAMAEETKLSIAGAFVLSLGIAIQNFPEGAMISIPIYENGKKKGKAFLCGMLSGAVEPLAAVSAILMSDIVVSVLPYLLGFAAGAMLFVVLEEFRKEISVILFLAGFTVMLIFIILA